MKLLLTVAISCLLSIGAIAQVVTITAGGTYSGYNINSSDSTHPAIFINTTAPVTIEKSNITSYGECISNISGTNYVIGANVTIRDCSLTYSGPSNASKILVFMYIPGSILVNHCFFWGTPSGHGLAPGGVVVQSDGRAITPEIQVLDNYFLDCAPAFQVISIPNDPNMEIAFNEIAQGTTCKHGDEINIYGSSGTPASPIWIYQNLVAATPDAPQTSSGECIQAGDGGNIKSTYVKVEQNTTLNGESGGISLYYNNQGTSSAISNTIVGLGYNLTYSDGLDLTGGGTAQNNQVVFWDTVDQKIFDYYPASLSGQNGNVSLPPSDLTLSYEMTIFQNWANLMAAENHKIGRSGVQTPTYPAASDFPPNP